MTQPKLSALPIWERHEARVLTTLRMGLDTLSRESLGGGELELNRSLYLAILTAIRQLYTAGWDTPEAPVWEGKNPPTPDTADTGSERKIPDLSWDFIDHEHPDPAAAVRRFVVECKRLGRPTPGGRQLNRAYVEEGIVRFIDSAWSYGRNAQSGAMIGYIQEMECDDVLSEVNVVAALNGIADLQWTVQSSPLLELSHELVRSFPRSPYRLIHLWISESPS